MKHKNKISILALVIFLFFFGYWTIIAIHHQQGETNSAERWSALYGIMALYGGVVGLFVSRRWGGLRSLIGKSVVFMSCGLLAQEFGQVAYSAYTYLFHVEIPYPSLGDVGYFGSVIFYILGIIYLIKALSIKKTTGTFLGKFWLALLPVVLLTCSYCMFLRGYSFDFHHPLVIFLDFGYPLGQAFYISLALAVFILSKRYLGGVMKPVILFLIFALILQYSSDFTFLYQNSRSTWKTAGFNELMYLTSYFVMTLSLINFGAALDRLQNKSRA